MAPRSILYLVPLFLGAADAWGPDGHTIVAHIADYFLSKEVASVLSTDLEGVNLNNVSDWADDFDHTRDGHWSEKLHFIDYPGKACKFVWATDCSDNMCNVGGIANYSKQIFDSSMSKDDRFVALKMVIHLVGDVHQPLHVSSGDDFGGNKITMPFPHFSSLQANWTGGDTNLHSVWDDKIINQDIYDMEDSQNKLLRSSGFVPTYHDWQLIADMLEKKMEGEWASNKTAWMSTVAGVKDDAQLHAGLTAVAEETAAAGCTYAYNYADGSAVTIDDTLDRDYFLRAKPIVEEQLAKGGVRLAQILQEALEQSRASTTIVV